MKNLFMCLDVSGFVPFAVLLISLSKGADLLLLSVVNSNSLLYICSVTSLHQALKLKKTNEIATEKIF